MTAASRNVKPLSSAAAAIDSVDAVPLESRPLEVESYETEVLEWLQGNPSFFDTHAHLLAEIRIRHPYGERAISLIERQVAVLREKNQLVESRLAELIRIGQQNDSIGDRLQQLTLDLLQAEDRAAIPGLLIARLTELFDVPQVALRVWDWPDATAPWAGPVDADMRRRAEQLEGVYCGPKSDFGSARWLPGEGEQTESIAMLALREPAADRADAILRGRRPDRSACFGLLVLGSPDAGRFQAGLGTAFLGRLAELAGAALSRPDSQPRGAGPSAA